MNKKLIVTIALVAVLAFFGYRAYAARPVRFSDNGWGGALTGDPACMNPDTPEGYKYCGLVGFVFNEPHHFDVGDRVEVQQDDGTNLYYNGPANVVWANKISIIIDKGFGESTGPEGGIIKKIA